MTASTVIHPSRFHQCSKLVEGNTLPHLKPIRNKYLIVKYIHSQARVIPRRTLAPELATASEHGGPRGWTHERTLSSILQRALQKRNPPPPPRRRRGGRYISLARKLLKINYLCHVK